MIEHNTRLILAPCPFARCFRRFVLSSYTFIVQRVAAVMLVIRRSVEEPFVSDCQGLEISSLEADKIYSESKKCSSRHRPSLAEVGYDFVYFKCRNYSAVAQRDF